MTRNILERPVTRGNLWVAAFTWAEAIENHAEAADAGCCRFIVTDAGIWLEGDGKRGTVYRTKLPKDAEAFARDRIVRAGLVPSPRDARLRVGPAYAKPVGVR